MSAASAARWLDLPSFRDPRGALTVIEAGTTAPFEIRRVFFLHEVVAERAGHAHRDADQILVAAAGSFVAELSDARGGASHEMRDPARGLHVPRMTFVRLRDFSPGAVCLVLASTHYDPERSIRTWDDYCRAVGVPARPAP